jgi:hypothetical protein
METEFILLCATGRSGSTTLQRILNTIPNTNIQGENDNAILHLLEFYKSIKCNLIVNMPYSTFIKNNIKPCWYNHFDKNAVVDEIKKMIVKFLNYDNNYKILGFKEIRYDNTNIHLLNEFKELFPNTKFIFHTRDPEEQCKSGWWNENQAESKKRLYDVNRCFYNFYIKSNFKNDIYMSYFKCLFSIDKLKDMFIFLNKSNYFDEEKINNIIKHNQH